MRRRGPKPFCACGCKVRVKKWVHRYFSRACVPTERRQAGGYQSALVRGHAARRRCFAKVLADLTRDGQTITQVALLAAFRQVFDHAYRMGYHAAEDKWERRTGTRTAA